MEAQRDDISLIFRNGVTSFICGILLILSFLVFSVTFRLGVGRFETSDCRNRVLVEIILWKNTTLFKCVWQWLYSKNAWPLKYFKFIVSQFQASLGKSQETVVVIVLFLSAKMSLLCKEQQTSYWTSFYFW